MKITYMTPNELVPYDKNPRINDESVDWQELTGEKAVLVNG